MKLATASLNQTPIDWANNKNNILAAIAQAKKEDVDLLCLPEMCITGYGCEDLFLHAWVAEKAFAVLQELLPETTGIATSFGLPYHYQGKIYNVICLVNDGKILGFQAKQNLPNDGIHYETRWFSAWKPGELGRIKIDEVEYPFGDNIYRVGNSTVGFEICEDAWVKDRPACRLVEKGVDIILNPSASHFAMLKSQIREQKVIDASATFNCTYIFANQLGNEAGRVIYDGDAIIAHKGELVANTPLFSFHNFELTWCEIDDKTGVTNKSITRHKNLREEQFIEATSLALYDYLRKSKSHGFVLSLSGGADSSTCLVLVSEMIKRGIKALGTSGFLENIGFENNSNLNTYEKIAHKLITVAYQSTDNSSKQTFKAAQELANSVKAQFFQWSVKDEVNNAQNVIESVIGRELSWEKDDIVLQNIQARSRSPLIWMLANLNNALLLTTSNRSEGSVGYATMDGDTSGSLAPIAGIDKPFLISWLKWAETELGYSGLNKVNGLTPTAELRPGDYDQSDEDDLMPYPILNQIERLFILQRLSPKLIHRELSDSIESRTAAEYVIKFFRLLAHNQWKRERLAPSFHLADYNIDPRSWFRFPILSGGFNNELDELKKLVR